MAPILHFKYKKIRGLVRVFALPTQEVPCPNGELHAQGGGHIMQGGCLRTICWLLLARATAPPRAGWT
jgi:hypothetical protein